jgi:hypothetical protein
LNTPGRAPKQVFIQPSVNLAQPFQRHAFREGQAFGQFQGIAGIPVEIP